MTVFKLLLLLLLLFGFSARPASGIAPVNPSATATPACKVDPAKLRGICNDVYSRTEDAGNPDEWTYAYERKVLQASCVNFSKDTAQSARFKVQNLWSSHYASKGLACNGLNFQVENGSILKYAVEMRTYGVLDKAIKAWQWELNFIDASDHKTILDFVDDKIQQSRAASAQEPSPNLPVLQGYASALARRGAKRCIDLIGTKYCAEVRGEDAIQAVAKHNAGLQAQQRQRFEQFLATAK